MVQCRALTALALASASLLAAGAASQAAPREVTASFRSDAAHSGVFDSRPVTRQPAVRWHFDTQGPVRSSPIVAGSLVLFGSGDGNLYAVEAASGTLAWKAATGGAVDSTPAVAGGTVFFSSRDRKVYAVDFATGAARWSVSLGDELPFAWDFDVFLSSAVVDGDGVIVGGGDGVLYRLAAASGAVQWRFRTAGRIRSSPALAGGVVYVGSMDGRLYAVDARKGSLRWKFDSDGVALDSEKEGFDRRTINSSPAVASGIVTFGTRDNHQYALDAATGRLLWKAPHPVTSLPGNPEVSWVEGSPVVAAGVTYVGASDGYVVDARDLRTGKELWHFSTPSRDNASPALAGDALYAPCEDGNLYAIDAKTGRGLWRFHTPNMILSSPAVATGVIYVGSDDGSLYALSDQDAGGRRVPAKAVYFDGKLQPAYFGGGKALRDALADANYSPLDSTTLAGFLSSRAADRTPSVVVFASDEVPSDVIDTPPAGGPCLLRRYLEAGGRVVWVGISPFMLKLDVATGKRARSDPQTMSRILGFGVPAIKILDTEEARSVATAEGRAWGLPAWTMLSFPVDPKDVSIVLARDDDGKARAWVKTFGPGQSGAFVRYWGKQGAAAPEAALVTRLAEHGLGAPAS